MAGALPVMRCGVHVLQLVGRMFGLSGRRFGHASGIFLAAMLADGDSGAARGYAGLPFWRASHNLNLVSPPRSNQAGSRNFIRHLPEYKLPTISNRISNRICLSTEFPPPLGSPPCLPPPNFLHRYELYAVFAVETAASGAPDIPPREPQVHRPGCCPSPTASPTAENSLLEG